MKKIYTLLALLLILASVNHSYCQTSETDTISTYFLIRHAEKDRSDATNKNPHLSEKGKARAEQWSVLLDNFTIDAVFSTNYYRTLETAQPTADNMGVKVKTYHPFQIDMEDFIKDTRGKNILIVGHSNTIPAFVNTLIGEEVYPDMEDDNNADLYIVTISSAGIKHILIKTK